MTVLRQHMLEDMRVRNLSPHTQSSYVLQVSLFARHFGRLECRDRLFILSDLDGVVSTNLMLVQFRVGF